MEKLSRQIASLPVFSVNEGEQIGSVKNLVIDPAAKEIIALVIDQKGWFREGKIIPFNKVSSIGDNAITVEKSGTAERPSNLPQIVKLIKNPTSLINSKIVSTAGKTLGYIEEFWFDSTGKITKIEISGRFLEGWLKGKAYLPAEEIVTIGKDVVIVKEGAEQHLVSGEKNLQVTFNELKSVTSKAWKTTVHKSQKLGHALAASLSKFTEEEEKLPIENHPPQRETPPKEENREDDEETTIPEASPCSPETPEEAPENMENEPEDKQDANNKKDS
jgi:uncharacterized protein YrrD